MPCPCGSKNPLESCCGPYIEGKKPAPTPEALMRSRYTAYTQANIRYIQSTMMGKALEGFNATEAKAWAQSVAWLGLRVMDSSVDKHNPDLGFVTFEATFLSDGQPAHIREKSEFHRVGGEWFYVVRSEGP